MALALWATGPSACAQLAGTPAPGTAEGGGWQGLAPVEPETGAPREARQPSEAEAAGLRTGQRLPGAFGSAASERDRQRATARRAPWLAGSPQPPGLAPVPGISPPPPAARRITSGPAAVANPRTGRLPRRAADPSVTPAGRLAGPRTFPQAGGSPRTTLSPGREDARALERGTRGIAPPPQPRRPVDVPIVAERIQQPSGRVLPNANPLGRNVRIDPRTGEVVSFDRRVQPEVDPFAATGLRVGSFIVTPQADLTLGYDSNPRRVSAGSPGSLFTQSYGEVQARSDWSRHEVTARLRGTYSAYFSDPGVNRPEVAAVATGRIDVARDTRIETEARYNLIANAPGSSNLPSAPDGLRNLPLIRQYGATAGVVQDIGRLQLSLRGTVDRVTHDDAVTNAGTLIPQGERNYVALGGRLRASYELTPGVRPFVEAAIERRSFDQPVTSGGLQQGSNAFTARIGSTFELTRLLTGEIAAGYLLRRSAEPTFTDIRVPVLDASLIWTVTPLTTLRLTARSTVDESFTTGASGIQRHDLAVELEHAFRRWLTGTARLAYGQDRYAGTTRTDQRMIASVGLVYRASRNLQIRGELRREALMSSAVGQSYTTNIVLMGLRLQR
ncbi:outer membrane beta-barrel protein [Phreatobacter sp.]|uniref:outer membrane beta-barrel protein n=1 Tax=Phreatobacter sp. TaxID=1966341 RepID=UPI003F714271